MATDSPATLLTAAHGFYQFAVPQDVFDRSLYYNLLLQPTIAIPDLASPVSSDTACR